MLFSNFKIFFSQSSRHFRNTGAIVPSSRSVAMQLSESLSRPDRAPMRILEVGPGTGVVTKVIASRMIAGDTLDICEINPVFAKLISETIDNEPLFASVRRSIRVFERNILDHSVDDGSACYDLIVCGLPFNNFQQNLVARIFDHLSSLLAPHGSLSYFEYLAVRRFKNTFMNKGVSRDDVVSQDGKNPRIFKSLKSKIVFSNLPPAIIHHLGKSESP